MISRNVTILTAGIRAGERATLARAITLIESKRADHRVQSHRLVQALLSLTGKAVRLGITGAPGAGKSTTIDALGTYLTGKGHKVAVLAVDPSSTRTGGLILGDKTRMARVRAPFAFLRHVRGPRRQAAQDLEQAIGARARGGGVSTFIARALFVALAAITLSGCIDSENPILADAEPVFGKHLTLQFYALRNGAAHEPQRAVYNWNGGLYARVSGGMHDVPTFTVHPFEDGDYLIQETAARAPRLTEYALLHPLADGVYQILPIDADDADDQTRAAYCRTVGKSSCRIGTRAQLFAFARATAALRKKNGGLVILLDETSHRRRR